jgi:glycosyltransferase involved in cell wall biosynthesis
VDHTPEITALLYAQDDASLIEAAAAELAAALVQHAPAAEIILLDDAGPTPSETQAPDPTPQTPPAIRVHHQTAPTGFGACLRAGIALARHPIVLVLDVREGLDCAALAEALQALGGETPCDLVVGCRTRLPGDRRRRLAYRLYRAFCRAVFGLPVRDVNCRFRLYRRAVFDRIIVQSDGCFADAEVLAKAGFFGFVIGEVDVAARLVGERKSCYRQALREAWTVFNRPALLERPAEC